MGVTLKAQVASGVHHRCRAVRKQHYVFVFIFHRNISNSSANIECFMLQIPIDIAVFEARDVCCKRMEVVPRNCYQIKHKSKHLVNLGKHTRRSYISKVERI